MVESDKEPFFVLIADVCSFYDKGFSTFVGSVWWNAMRPFDFAAVRGAISRHSVNPDGGQFMPKPADVVRMLQGTTQDAALVAWALVDRSVRTIGPHQSVIFDDAITHRVLHDMGGWIALTRHTDKEWPFVAKEFENRYRGYRMAANLPQYPKVLLGEIDAHNQMLGLAPAAMVLIGNQDRARQVLLGGTAGPLLEFERIAPEDVATYMLPAPNSSGQGRAFQ